MVQNIRKLLIIVIGYLAASCADNQHYNNVIFDSEIYTPSCASGFVIESDNNNNTLIRVTRPWQGDAITEQTLAIFQSEKDADNYSGQHIIGTAERIVCMSSSHIAMLDAIGKIDDIVGVSGKQYILNEHIPNNSEVIDIGYDSNIDYEALLTLKPDLVLMYGITAENSSVTAKLRELGISYLYLGDYTEQSPLGKAEWMIVMGEITGCRDESVKLFEGIVARYNDIKNNITNNYKPRVMFNLPYQDVWYMPSDDSYMVRLIEDAGGEYIYKGKNPTGGSKGISIEEALLLVNSSDIWMNTGQCLSLDELKVSAPHFADCDIVKRGNVYNNNRRRSPSGGSDFWEGAIVHPDIVLSDLAKIMQGEEQDLYYHHKLK